MDTTAVWTAERILALAPDPSSAKAGREHATSRKWVTLGQSEGAIWGECQGSGASPYKTEVDLSEPAFKCTCPSHKFPCKHGLGLFLLFEAQASSFPKGEPPAWVAEWLKSRAKRAEQATAKREQAANGKVELATQRVPRQSPAARAKVAAQRQARVSAGIRDLRTWLADLARNGLSAAQGKPYSFWEAPAARLVDAQAPGLARMVRSMAGIPSSGEGWPERLLEQMGKLYLLLESYERIDSLSPDTQADVRAMIGWTVSQDELLRSDGIRDLWTVMSRHVEEEERLRTQSTWLWGYTSGRAALVLDFAYGNQPLDMSLMPGTTIEAELVFFPGSVPQRALVKERRSILPTGKMAHRASMTISAAMESYANALALNPWIERFPMLLDDVTLRHEGDAWWLRDRDGKTLQLSPTFRNGWQTLGFVGGRPFIEFGEWNGRCLRALRAIPKSPE